MRTPWKNRVALGVVLAALVFAATHNIRAELPQAIGTWASLGATPESRVGAAAVALKDGRTVIAGGSVDGVATDSVVAFDPNTGSFSIVGHLLLARVGHTATLLDDGRVLIAGGTAGDLISADIELFDPANGVSALGGSMAQPRTGHAAAKLADGKVLIVGGTSIDGVLQDAEVYDPETGTTTPTVLPMLSPRTGASATTLIDGRVLVAGGHNGTADLASAEIFEPSSQIFEAATTSLSFARSGHAAVLLPNNNSVLIAGGSSNGVPVPTSDLFLPAEFPDPYSYGMGSFAQTSDLLAARSRAIASPHIEGYAVAMGGGAPEAEVYRFPTIKTDKDDYPPGQRAIITGAGWEPNSEVTLLFQEDPAVHDDYVLHVPTDGEGNFSWDQWAPEQHDLNVRFYLMAKQTTLQGERRAQTTFTDANRQLNIDSFSITAPSGAVDNTMNVSQPFTVHMAFSKTGGTWTNVTGVLTVPATWSKSADLSIASLPGTATFDWTVTPSATPAANQTISVSLTGTPPSGDGCNQCPAVSSITAVNSVNAGALTITSMTAAKTVGGGTLVKAGDSITVTMVVANGTAPRATANSVEASALMVNPTGTATGTCAASGTAAANIAAGGNRTYTYTCTATGGDGTLTFTGSGNGTDQNSGASVGTGDSTTNSITVDSTAPGVPSIPDMTAGTDTGALNTDNITNDNTPTFTGTADAGSTVKIFSDGVQVGSDTAAAYAAGITVSSLLNGPHSITVTAADLAGNESAVSSGLSVMIDTVKPTVTINQAAGQADPTNTQPVNFTAVFNEAINASTFTGIDVTLGGTAGNLASATKMITLVGGNTHNVAVSGLTTDGTVTASIPAGGVEDVAGNTNTVSTSTDQTVTLDTAAPAQPAVPDLNSGDDTGVSNLDNVTNQTTNLRFMGGGGSAEGNSTVEVFDGSTSLGTTTASNGGSWNFTAAGPFSEGVHLITVTAKDAAGNVSVASSALTVRIDVTKPNVTINQAAGQTDPTGTLPINFTATFDEAIDATTFIGTDVALSGTAGNLSGATKTITFVSGSYNVAISGLTTGGTVIAAITAGGVADLAGNTNFASTSTDNTVTYAASTTTSVSSSLNPSVYGDAVSFTATVTVDGGGATPTGSVQFKIDSVNFGSPVTLSSGSAASDNISSLSVGTHVVTAEYTSDASLLSSTGTLAGGQVVNAATLDITAAGGKSKFYGDTFTAFTGSVVGLKNTDAVTVTYASTGAPAAAGVASYDITVASYSFTTGSADNYDIHMHTAANGLTVNPATLDITPDGGKSKFYGDTFTAFTGSVVGLKNTDAVTVTYASTGAPAGAGVASYDITVASYSFTTGSTDNYDIHTHTAANGLTVNPATLDITPDGGKSKFYGDTFTAFTGSVVGLKNTDAVTVTYASTGAPAAAGVASYDITVASYSFTTGSADNYDIHTHTAANGLTVNPATLDITPDGGKSKFYGDTFTAFTGSVVGLKDTDAVTVTYASTGAPAAAGVASYDITVASYSFTTGSADNYDIHTHTATNGLTVNPATLDITPDGGKSKFYGDTFAAFTGSVVGLKNTDAVTVTYVSTGAPAAAGVASYDITVASYSFTTGSADNYDIHTHTATNGLTVNPATLDITAAGGKSKVYGQTFTAFTGSVVGLKNSDAISVTYASTGAPAAAIPGSYDITVASYSFTVGSAANYDIHTHTAINGLTVTYGTCNASYGPGGVILAPINSDGTSVYSRKGGSTIPVKFTVCDASGNPISDPAAVFSGTGGTLTMLSAVRGTFDFVNEPGVSEIPDVAFRWAGDKWIFNMATTKLQAGATYTFSINLAFGNIPFRVGLK